MNLGSLLDHCVTLRQVYIDTAREAGFKAGPEHYGYLVKVLVADTDEKAQEIGRHFMWIDKHRMKGPAEHNDPPGYQSREAVKIMTSLPGAGGSGGRSRDLTYEDQQELNTLMIGSPQTVIRKLAGIMDKLRPGYLLIFGNDGRMPHKDVMRSIELIGKEVIPSLHEIKLQPYE